MSGLKPRFSLSWKIILFTMIPFLMVLIALCAMTIDEKIQNERDLSANRIDSYVALLESGDLSFESVMQKEKLGNMFDEKVISSELIGRDRSVIYSTGTSEYDVDKELIEAAYDGSIVTYTVHGEQSVLVSLYPIVVKDVVVGVLHLELSYEKKDDRIMSYIIFIILISLSGLVVSFIMVMFISQRIVISRIEDLNVMSYEICKGNFQYRLDDKSNDELGILANAFNNMSEELFRAKDVLLESEQRYRLLAENTLDVIWTMDLDLTFTYVNPSVFEMLGFTPEEWIGSKLPEHCSHEDMEKIQDIIVSEIEANEKHRWVVFESVFFNKDGKGIPCEVNARILFDENGRPISMQGTTRDISERKQAEVKLNNMLVELKRSNSDLEQFAYVSSHDLQEPLRTISGYVDLIKRKYKGKLDSDMDKYIEIVVDGVRRMQLLIDDLLKYSRVGTHTNPFVSTDCETALEDAILNLKVSIDDSKTTITHDPLPTVIADGLQLTQVFQNLIGNAIKFRGDKTPYVHISAEKKRDEWMFSISDNGIGIEPEFFDRIFVIFNRLHSKEKYSGTGMGLSICKKIVERHGGRIWVESTVGSGSTFYFTIRRFK